MNEPGPSPAIDWDGTIEAMNLAGGLCHSEAHRMEAAHRPTAEHWRSVATRLHGGALALAAWAAKGDVLRIRGTPTVTLEARPR